MTSFLKDVFSAGFSKVIVILFQLITSIIIARIIGPEGNGIIAALLVYPSLFMSFGSMGISQSTTYFIGKKIYDENKIKSAISHIWLFTSLLSLVMCFFLMYYFSKAGEDLWLVTLALIPIPFALFNSYNSGIFLGNNQIGSFNKIHWIHSLIVLILTMLLVWWFEFGISGAMIAMMGGPFFIFIVLFLRNNFFIAISSKFEWQIVKAMLRLGLVYAFALLIINLNYKVDVILLDKISTPFELGIYSKGSGITQYLWQIPMLFNNIVFARSAISKDGLAFSYKIAQLLRLSLVVIGLGSLFLFLFSNTIITGLYGEAYEGSVSVLNLLLPGVLLLTFYKAMNTDLAGKGKPWVALKAMAPALPINILLNIWLIPIYGADGAAFASTVSYSFAAILFMHFYSKEVKIPVKEILRYSRSDFTTVFERMRNLLN